jgi:3-oxoacyl-[acyl-carrier protein] reductase
VSRSIYTAGLVLIYATGIGAGIAEHLASKGCSIALGYTSPTSEEKARTLSSRLSDDYNVSVSPIQADLGTPEGGSQLVSKAKEYFSKNGKFQIDIIVNNAGVGFFAPVEKVTIEDFHTIYNTNVLGPLLLVQAAFPYLPTDRSGRIVNISSIAANMAMRNQSLYAGSKGALDSMTRTWASELAERTTVNSINPGPVVTDMYNSAGKGYLDALRPWVQHTPLSAVTEERDGMEAVDRLPLTGGRAATIEEIAKIVGMICSDESGWCTGSIINANGGMIPSL